jgi:hypothetical protein
MGDEKENPEEDGAELLEISSLSSLGKCLVE